MLPGLYEFRWDTGHIVFLGAFYTVLLIVGTFLLASALRARRDLRQRRAEALLWEEEFHALAPQRRRCRHALTGELPGRVCDRAFDCRECAKHGELLAALHTNERSTAEAELPLPARPAAPTSQTAGQGTVYGFDMPLDRLYHRGHAWVRPAADGLLEIGIDDMGTRLIGKVDGVVLPKVGQQLVVNGTAWEFSWHGATTRVLSPVEGTVVEAASDGHEWVVRVRPTQPQAALTHLLRGDELRPWVLDELERLQQLLGAPHAGATLADGGAPVRDFTRAVPDADWDGIYGEMFLQT